MYANRSTRIATLVYVLLHWILNLKKTELDFQQVDMKIMLFLQYVCECITRHRVLMMTCSTIHADQMYCILKCNHAKSRMLSIQVQFVYL